MPYEDLKFTKTNRMDKIIGEIGDVLVELQLTRSEQLELLAILLTDEAQQIKEEELKKVI